MHGQAVIEALQAHFGGAYESPGNLCWQLRCLDIRRANGVATLDVDIWGATDAPHIHLAVIAASPEGLGVGTEAMEVLAGYCRPRGISIDLHALKDSARFFRRFNWLRETAPGSQAFKTTW